MSTPDTTNDSGDVRAYHPVLFALVPILGLYAQNVGKVPFFSLFRSAAVLVLGALLTWLLFAWPMRDKNRGAMAATVVIFSLLPGWTLLEYAIEWLTPFTPWFSEGRLWLLYLVFALSAIAALATLLGFNRNLRTGKACTACALTVLVAALLFLAAQIVMSAIFGIVAAWLICAYLMGVFVALALVLLRVSDFRRSTRTVNWFALVLTLLFLADCLYQYPWHGTTQPPPLSIEVTREEPQEGWPDIYVIALDGYARADVLRTRYGYNNGPFLDSLAQKGFTIPENSFANYANSMASLASCLNLDYLETVLPEPQDATGAVTDLADFCRGNRVVDFVKQRGYRVLVFSPGVATREPRDEADECLDPPWALNEFEVVLLGSIAPSRIIQMAYFLTSGNPYYWSYTSLRRHTLHQFRELGNLASQDSSSPRLVFAQLTLPGPPFLFDKDGEWAIPAGVPYRYLTEAFLGPEEEFRSRYRGQLRYTSLLLQEALDRIVSESSRPPVVLVLSTHGPIPRPAADFSAEELDEQFGVLVAARFPTEFDGPSLDDAPSLVNLFRIVFNRVFGAKLPLLQDERRYPIPNDPAPPHNTNAPTEQPE